MKRSVSTRNAQFEFKEKDFIYQNWLKKQGGKFRTSKRRYFILVQNVLYYFTNHTRNVLKGQINLKNLELSELEEDKANSEYIFYILPEKGKDCVNEGHVKYLLSTNEKKDAETWMFYLKQSMYLERGGGLFGTSLGVVMPYLKEEYCYVPRIIFECCKYIRNHGIDEEGIFRKNGQLSLVLQMKEKVDRAMYEWIDPDIHTVCSLLKLYLRELPEPVIPFYHYDSLKAVGYRIDVKENLGLVKEKLYLLPLPNLQLLKYLSQFLMEVSHHPANRMEITSLAKVFSPNILRDQDTDPYVEESTNSVITVTVAAFIKSQDELFQFEYEPLYKYDGEPNFRDEDTFSLKSAFSFMNFNSDGVTDEETKRSITSLPQIQNSPNRVQSMIIINDSFSERTRSQDTIVNTITRPRVELTEFSEKTPISLKKFPNIRSNDNDKDSIKTLRNCDRCNELQKKLSAVTDDRDRLQRSYDVKSKTCMQLQAEIELLQNELTKSRKLRAENASDLSDVLEYFQMNKF